MIQRFNFYDIYGYFIPGLAVLLLLWLPFGILSRQLIRVETVTLALIVAYPLGHIVQSISANVLTPRVARDANGIRQLPSMTVLDQSRFKVLRSRIETNARSWFDIDLSDQEISLDDRHARRQAAFMLSRPIVNARTSYAEQFEGLYTMMRGLATATGVCSLYLIGWALSGHREDTDTAVAVMIIGFCLVALIALSCIRAAGRWERHRNDAATLATISLLLITLGYIAAISQKHSLDASSHLVFGACAFLSAAAALRFFVLYEYFAGEFAAAVWTNFAIEPTQRPA